jgi:hypothetical protein
MKRGSSSDTASFEFKTRAPKTLFSNMMRKIMALDADERGICIAQLQRAVSVVSGFQSEVPAVITGEQNPEHYVQLRAYLEEVPLDGLEEAVRAFADAMESRSKANEAEFLRMKFDQLFGFEGPRFN